MFSDQFLYYINISVLVNRFFSWRVCAFKSLLRCGISYLNVLDSLPLRYSLILLLSTSITVVVHSSMRPSDWRWQTIISYPSAPLVSSLIQVASLVLPVVSAPAWWTAALSFSANIDRKVGIAHARPRDHHSETSCLKLDHSRNSSHAGLHL